MRFIAICLTGFIVHQMTQLRPATAEPLLTLYTWESLIN